jgi:hypothetical protein
MGPRHPNPLWHTRLSNRIRQNPAPYLPYSIGEFHTSTKPKCRVCWDTLDEEIAPMPCGHYWCGSCITKAFASVKNESQWPVVCIGWTSCSIPFDTAKAFLGHEEIRRLVPLIEEFDAPALGRTYCSNVRCGIFIPRREAKDRIAHCQACQTDTCSDCKGPAMEPILVRYQTKANNNFSSYRTKINGSDAHDVARCTRKALVVVAYNVFADTNFAIAAQDPTSLASARITITSSLAPKAEIKSRYPTR